MHGKILKFAQPTKGIQIEAVFKGIVTPLWCDVPRDLLYILEKPYTIGDEVDFLYTPNAKGNGRTLTKFELIKPETAKDDFVPANKPIEFVKTDYQERDEFKQKLIIRQNCLSHATSILGMMPANINREYLVNTTIEIAKDLEKYVWGELNEKRLE